MKHLYFLILTIFFQNNLICMQCAAPYAKASIVGVASWAALDKVVAFSKSNSEKYKLSEDRKKEIKDKLRGLRARGLLCCESEKIKPLKGDLATNGTFSKCLYVPEDGEINEFSLLHEAGHINGNHAALRIAPYATVIFWPNVYYRHSKSPRILAASLLLFSASQIYSYFLSRKAELDADMFAAKNCSSIKDFSKQILEYKEIEEFMIKDFQGRFGLSQENAHNLFALTDAHTPFNKSRTAKLTEIFQARLMSNSLQ